MNIIPHDGDGEQADFTGTVEDPVATMGFFLGVAFDTVAWTCNNRAFS